MAKILTINEKNIKVIRGNPRIVEEHIKKGGRVEIVGGNIGRQLPIGLQIKIEKSQKTENTIIMKRQSKRKKKKGRR